MSDATVIRSLAKVLVATAWARAEPIPNAELRKLNLAGGLLARIACIDRQVADGEYQEIVQTFCAA